MPLGVNEVLRKTSSSSERKYTAPVRCENLTKMPPRILVRNQCFTKDQHKYTDKFSLSVVNLNCIDLATEEDHASHLVEWAKMFKAKTWEELRMLAEKNPAIDEAVTKIYTLTQEDIIREQMEAEELYYLSIQKRDEALAKKDEELVRKDELIEKAQLEIDRLKSIIAANNIKVD